MRALLVEDSRDVREALAVTLADMGFCCISEATSVEDAMRSYMVTGPFDVYLVDLILPGAHGSCFIQELPLACRSKILVLSAYVDKNVRYMMKHLGLKKRQVVAKPFDLACLRDKIQQIVEKGELNDTGSDPSSG